MTYKSCNNCMHKIPFLFLGGRLAQCAVVKSSIPGYQSQTFCDLEVDPRFDLLTHCTSQYLLFEKGSCWDRFKNFLFK